MNGHAGPQFEWCEEKSITNKWCLPFDASLLVDPSQLCRELCAILWPGPLHIIIQAQNTEYETHSLFQRPYTRETVHSAL